MRLILALRDLQLKMSIHRSWRCHLDLRSFALISSKNCKIIKTRLNLRLIKLQWYQATSRNLQIRISTNITYNSAQSFILRNNRWFSVQRDNSPLSMMMRWKILMRLFSSQVLISKPRAEISIFQTQVFLITEYLSRLNNHSLLRLLAFNLNFCTEQKNRILIKKLSLGWSNEMLSWFQRSYISWRTR